MYTYVPGEDGLRVAVVEVVQLDEAGGFSLAATWREGHVAAEVAAVRVERHQPTYGSNSALLLYPASTV